MAGQSSTDSSTLTNVSFLNLFGIVLTVILMVVMMILGAHTMKYIKKFAVKIKIISNRSSDRNIQLKEYGYKLRHIKSKAYNRMEAYYKNEIKRSRSLVYWNIVKAYIEKYDHVVYYPFRNKVAENYNLLKPKGSFFTLILAISLSSVWMLTVFLTFML
jgi:hypothetical protein